MPSDLERFDPHTVDAVVDEVARWRVPRSRARDDVANFDVDGRSPAQVRAAVLTDYVYTLPAARGALAHARAGGNSHLLMIGPAEGAPAVHETELYALVGQEEPALASSFPTAKEQPSQPASSFATAQEGGGAGHA